MREENDYARRVAINEQVQEMTHVQLPSLMSAWLNISEPVRTEVQGDEMDSFSKHIFKQISLEK